MVTPGLRVPGFFIGTYSSITFSKYIESIPSECPPTSFHLRKILSRPGSDPDSYSSTPVFHSKVDFNENFVQHPVGNKKMSARQNDSYCQQDKQV